MQRGAQPPLPKAGCKAMRHALISVLHACDPANYVHMSMAFRWSCPLKALWDYPCIGSAYPISFLVGVSAERSADVQVLALQHALLEIGKSIPGPVQISLEVGCLFRGC